MMEGRWEDHRELHFSLLGENVLVDGLHLDSARSFFVASVLTILICVTERLLTYAISKKWTPFSDRWASRAGTALWRACLYWLVTFDRLLYMLIAMSFNLGLIIVAVTTLAIGQFIMEYRDLAGPSTHDSENVKEPLLQSSVDDSYQPEPTSSYPPSHPHRLRSRSKPENIFIHPNHSNVARADAAAIQLGLSGDTEFVAGNVYPEDGDSWELGQGNEVARKLFGR